MATNLEIISKEFIKPSSPTPHNLKRFQFSFLDQIQYPNYMSFILFYQKSSSPPKYSSTSDHEEKMLHISQRLKQSLSVALAKYYPLAGRITGELFVDCNDSGALLMEARVDARTFLSKEYIEKVPVEEVIKSYLPLGRFTALDYSIPLAVQISLFQCGGVAIGAQMSHQVGDVISLVTFLKSWATICRGDSESMNPNFDLGLRYFPSMQLPEMPSKEAIDDVRKKEKIMTKNFLFDKKKLAELKALASSTPAASEPTENPTRVEVVSAFICQKLIEINAAKVHDHHHNKFFAILHVVNLRPRLIRQQQELDDHFPFGNFSSISVSVLPISGKNVQEFSELTNAVRSATRKFNYDNEENIRNKMIDANRQHIGNFGNSNFEYCFFTSWCKFDVDKLDFGWGKPCLVRTKVLPFKNTVVLMDTECGDGIKALVTLAEEDVAMLPSDFSLLQTEN